MHKKYLTEFNIIPIIQTMVIRIANYPDRLEPSGKFVENSTKLTGLEVTGTGRYTAV
jgi:hypothetical protein